MKPQVKPVKPAKTMMIRRVCKLRDCSGSIVVSVPRAILDAAGLEVNMHVMFIVSCFGKLTIERADI